MKDALHMDNFVNADVIAQGLCAYQPEKAAIQAGLIMLSRIHTLANIEIEKFASDYFSPDSRGYSSDTQQNPGPMHQRHQNTPQYTSE